MVPRVLNRKLGKAGVILIIAGFAVMGVTELFAAVDIFNATQKGILESIGTLIFGAGLICLFINQLNILGENIDKQAAEEKKNRERKNDE